MMTHVCGLQCKRWIHIFILALVAPLMAEPAHGQQSENATVLSTEASTGEGSGPFTALGQAATANLFTGDATFSVPIQAPPGRGQATPALDLSYSSSAGDGPFGFGWSIGLGAVMRNTMHGVPKCVENQDFTLSLPGATVELVHEAGSSPSRYFAKVDEAYVEATADEANNEWTVRDRAGRTYRFGTAATARSWTGSDVFMDEVGCGFTAMWALTEIEDPNGNTIDFTCGNAGNTPVIDLIQYGANANAGLGHVFEIDFKPDASDPPNRTYPLENHRLGVPQVLSRLITQIDVRYRASSSDPSFHLDRSYQLEYSETPFGGRALLDVVMATGLPDRTFTYVRPEVDIIATETRPKPFTDNSLTLIKGDDYFRVENVLQDMNGDGIDDAVHIDPSTGSWAVYLGSPEGFASSPITWNTSSLPPADRGKFRETYRGDSRNKTLIDTIDLTGDGIPDWVDARASDPVACDFWAICSWAVHPGYCTSATDCGFSEALAWSAPAQHLSVDRIITPGDPGNHWEAGSVTEKVLIDLNGDAFPDHVRATGSTGSWIVHLGTATGFEATATAFEATGWIGAARGVSLSAGYVASRRRVFDFNGDGLPDLLEVDEAEYPDPTPWRLNMADGQLVLGNCTQCRVVNVLVVRLNTGAGFGPPIYSALGSSVTNFLSFEVHKKSPTLTGTFDEVCDGGDPCYEHVRIDFLDINADGLPDYLDMPHGYGAGRVLLNTGGGRLEMGPGVFADDGDVIIARTLDGLFHPDDQQWQGFPIRTRMSQKVGGIKSTAVLADVMDLDSDGLLEMVRADGATGTWKRTLFGPMQEPGQPVQPHARLVQADNGAGAVTGFRYKPSTYFPNAGSDGAPDLPFMRWVTTAVRQTDGLCTPAAGVDVFEPSLDHACLWSGNERLRRYDYADGRFAAEAREFRGFGTVVETDSNGNETESVFSQEDYTRGKLVHQVVRAVSGTGETYDLRIASNDWQTIGGSLHADRTQVYLAETSIEDRGVPDVLSERMCSLSRNESPDPYGRVSTTCTYECGAALLGSTCDEAAAGQVITHTEWADPTGGSYVRERPAEITSLYHDAGLTEVLLSKKRMRYDGAAGGAPLVKGLVTNGNVRYVESWLDQDATSPGFTGGWMPPVVMEYDAYGNLTSTTNERGFTWSSLFDPEYFSIHPTAQLAPTTVSGAIHETHVYTDLRFGKPLSITDPNGQTTHFRYDVLGRIMCEAGPGDDPGLCNTGGVFGVTREFYYAFGNPDTLNFEARHARVETRVANPHPDSPGYSSATEYIDALGRRRHTKVERVVNVLPGVFKTVIEGQVQLDSEGRPVKQYVPYESATASKNPAWVAATTLSYDLNGTGLFDPLGRVREVDPPGDERVVFSYRGRIYESQDETGAKTVLHRDHAGRTVLKERHDGSGAVLWRSFTYDGAGRVLTRLTSAQGATLVESAYDTLGRLVWRSDPNADGDWRYGYDLAGNLIYIDDPELDQHIQSHHDQQNRLSRRCTFDDTDGYDATAWILSCGTGTTEAIFYYDEAFSTHGIGALTTATDDFGSELFWYDARGRVERQERSVRGQTAEMSFEYDVAGRLAEVIYPDGLPVTYGYNRAGQLASISGVVSGVYYDVFGRVRLVTRNNGTADHRLYYGSEENFRLRDVRTTTTGGTAATYLDLTYTYNALGQVATVSDLRDASGALSNSAAYIYDGIGRLDLVTGSSFDDDFAFDPVGNLTLKDGRVLDYAGTTGPHQVGSFGPVTMTYTANGHRKTKNDPGAADGVLETYSYNELDQLVRIGVDSSNTVFEYGASGSLVSQIPDGLENQRIRYFSKYAETQSGTLTRHFWLGDVLIASEHVDLDLVGAFADFVIPVEWIAVFGGLVALLLLGAGLQLTPLPQEQVLAARSVGAVLLLLATGPPMLLFPSAAHAGGGGSPEPPYLGMRHYHTDHLGSTQAITDETGTLLQQIRYDAYGAMRTRLDGAGVDILAARHNDARRSFTGYEHEHMSKLQYAGARFYDPELGQFLIHDPAEQLPSPYAYGGGDPMNTIDPTGTFVESLFGLGIILGLFATGVSINRASMSGGSVLEAALLGIGGMALGFGLGIIAGMAGNVVGAGGGIINAAASLATNPLFQGAMFAASAGTQLYDFASGGNVPGWMGTTSMALGGLSLGLAFASASSSAAANGAQPAQVRRAQGGTEYADAGNVATDATPSEPSDFDRAVDTAASRASSRTAHLKSDTGAYVMEGRPSIWDRLSGATEGEVQIGDYRVTRANGVIAKGGNIGSPWNASSTPPTNVRALIIAPYGASSGYLTNKIAANAGFYRGLANQFSAPVTVIGPRGARTTFRPR